MMHARKTTALYVAERRRAYATRTFAPEAYGEFEIVPDAKIAEVREKMAAVYGFGNGDWEVVEDVAHP